jgi:catechol 2,3-dioxygenase-like lactoylglutathione lyase family enzyme
MAEMRGGGRPGAPSAPAGFNHIGHCVTDLDRSRRFYVEALGFEVERELQVPDAPADRLVRVEAPLGLTAVYLRRGDLVLELLHFDRPGNPPVRPRAMNEPGLTHLSFSVDDLAAAAARVAEMGGEVMPDTDVGAAVFVRDPDGQLIELLGRRRA